jgi:hypothetical protein
MPTLKEFANSSPGLFQPWVKKKSTMPNAESVRKCAIVANAFSVEVLVLWCPRVVAGSNPGLKFANSVGVQPQVRKINSSTSSPGQPQAQELNPKPGRLTYASVRVLCKAARV